MTKPADDLIKSAEFEKTEKDTYFEMLDEMDKAAQLVLQNRENFPEKVIAEAEKTLRENAEWRKKREAIPFKERLGR